MSIYAEMWDICHSSRKYDFVFSCFCVNSLARELLGKEGKEALKSMADSEFAGVRAGVSVYCEV